ncbi:MAG: hypothetical protein HY815_29025 [Candidatus Riflebacteria bacterium]|nr:hypothetical protein [Candidatus Riflebacteria bacterium]
MKARLVEIDFVFRVQLPEQPDPRVFTVRAGLLHGALDLTFGLGREDSENLPESLIEVIQEGLGYVRKTVRAKDLSEIDPEDPVG